MVCGDVTRNEIRFHQAQRNPAARQLQDAKEVSLIQVVPAEKLPLATAIDSAHSELPHQRAASERARKQ